MKRGYLAALLLASSPTLAADSGGSAPPRTVSPGGTERALASAGACPTFSWSSTAPADGYELALFESLQGVVPRDSSDPELKSVVRVEVAGDARSWTPSLEHCSAGDGLYVWFVRALREGEVTEWSRGSWFTIRPPAVPDREAIEALLRRSEERAVAAAGGFGGSADDTPGSAPRPSPAETTTLAEGSGPALTIEGDLVVGELLSRRVPGVSLGDIETDTTFPSRALGRLRASRFRLNFDLLGDAGADLYVGGFGGDRLQLGAPGAFATDCGSSCADLEVGRLFVERLLEVSGPLTFSAFTGYVGSGGAGYFEVPSVTTVRVDDNAADCAPRSVVGALLTETDTGQIGIRVICGAIPD